MEKLKEKYKNILEFIHINNKLELILGTQAIIIAIFLISGLIIGIDMGILEIIKHIR